MFGMTMLKSLLLPLLLILLFLTASAFADPPTALVRAAEQGDAEAQWRMGEIYSGGHFGVKKNYTEAFKWWLRAAEQGHKLAQSNLAALYQEGHGVKQDRAESYFWISVEVPRNDFDRIALVGAKRSAAEHLTPEQKAATDKRISNWKPSPFPAPRWWVQYQEERAKFGQTNFEGQDLDAFEKAAEKVGVRRAEERGSQQSSSWIKYQDDVPLGGADATGFRVEIDKEKKITRVARWVEVH